MSVGNVGVAKAKSEKYHFFFVSFVTYQPLTNGILSMVELVYLIVPWFLLFVMYEFVNG